MALASRPELRTAQVSLERLLDRANLLDSVAESGTGLGQLLTAACDLQLDLQVTPSGPVLARARRLCSELSHASPAHPGAVSGARQILRQLETTLSGT